MAIKAKAQAATKRGNGEGSYSKRPGGYIFRVLVNGQRVNGSGKTKAKAKAAALDRARLVADHTTRETFAELVDEWAAAGAAAHRLRPTTRDQYLTLVRTHIVVRPSTRHWACARRGPASSPSTPRLCPEPAG